MCNGKAVELLTVAFTGKAELGVTDWSQSIRRMRKSVRQEYNKFMNLARLTILAKLLLSEGRVAGGVTWLWVVPLTVELTV